jgi:hypothetical protein
MRRSGKAEAVVWTWQARFMAEGVEGLLREKTRKPGKPLSSDTMQRVVDFGIGADPQDCALGPNLLRSSGASQPLCMNNQHDLELSRW